MRCVLCLLWFRRLFPWVVVIVVVGSIVLFTLMCVVLFTFMFVIALIFAHVSYEEQLRNNTRHLPTQGGGAILHDICARTASCKKLRQNQSKHLPIQDGRAILHDICAQSTAGHSYP